MSVPTANMESRTVWITAAFGAVESSMTHISGFERSILLLPEAVDDYVGVDNPVRFIDAFVDELDLSAAGFVRVAGRRAAPAIRQPIC